MSKTDDAEFSEADDRWANLCSARVDRLWKTACSEYLEGFGALAIPMEEVPTLADVNAALEPITGWTLLPVEELIPAAVFFEHLSERRWPTTLGVRARTVEDVYERPDLFHDLIGHAPMLAEPLVADFIQRWAEQAMKRTDPAERDALTSLFWYTVELGMVQEGPRERLWGATLVSSLAHAEFLKDAPTTPFALEDVLKAPVAISEFPDTLWVIEDLEQLDPLLDETIAHFG